jgi:hypothetical protein
VSTIADALDDTDGTLLSAHTDGSGIGWTKSAGSDGGGDVQILSNVAQPTAAFTDPELYTFGAQPLSADYSVASTLASPGANGVNAVLLLRFDPTTGNGYAAGPSDFDGQFRLWSLAAGVGTLLNSSAISTPAVLEFECVGTGLTLRGDGVDLVTADDSTYASAGFGGLGYLVTQTSPDVAFGDFSITCAAGFAGQGAAIPSGDDTWPDMLGRPQSQSPTITVFA